MGNIYKIKDKHIDIMTDPDVSVDALARIGTNNCYKYIIRILVFIIRSSSKNFHFSHPSGKNIPGDAEGPHPLVENILGDAAQT